MSGTPISIKILLGLAGLALAIAVGFTIWEMVVFS